MLVTPNYFYLIIFTIFNTNLANIVVNNTSVGGFNQCKYMWIQYTPLICVIFENIILKDSYFRLEWLTVPKFKAFP